MKVSSEYTRLTETGDPRDRELAAAIRALRAERATPLEIAALAERLAPQLAAPPATPAALGLFSTSSKWLVSVLFTFGLSVFATLQFARTAPEPSAPRVVTPQPVAAPVELPPPLSAAIEPAVEEIVQPTATRPARAKPVMRAVQPPEPKAVEPRADAAAELELLGRAQRALDVEPRTALALALEHAATYPRGLFVQEREMLAIQALLELQQRRAAVARAKDFLNHYPTSPHARHLRPLLESRE